MSNKLKKSKKTIDLSKMSRTELEHGYMELYTRCAIAEYMKCEMEPSEDNTSAFEEESKADDEAEIKELVEKATGTDKKDKKNHGPIAKKNLDDLEVEVVEFKFSEEEQVCTKCGGPLKSIGTIVRRELEIAPPKVYIKNMHFHYLLID